MKKNKKNTKTYRIPKYSAGGQVALELAPLATSLISNKLNTGEVPTDGGNMLNYGGQGAAFGAQIGSVIPGVGTGIGAGVGAVAGAGYGLYSANKQQKAKRQADNINTANQQYSDVYGAQNPDMYQAPVYADGGFVPVYSSKGGLDRRLGAKYSHGGEVPANMIEVETGEIVADGDNITHIGKVPHSEGGDKLPVYNKGFKRSKDKPYAIAGGMVYSTQYSEEERNNISSNMKKVKFPISKGSKDRAQKTLDHMAALEGSPDVQFANGGTIPVYNSKGGWDRRLGAKYLHGGTIPIQNNKGGLDRRLGAKYDNGGKVNGIMRSPMNNADTRRYNQEAVEQSPYLASNYQAGPTANGMLPITAAQRANQEPINVNASPNMAGPVAVPINNNKQPSFDPAFGFSGQIGASPEFHAIQQAGKGPLPSSMRLTNTPYPVRAPYINPPAASDLNFPPLSQESIDKDENPGAYTRNVNNILEEMKTPAKQYKSALSMGWGNVPVDINGQPITPQNSPKYGGGAANNNVPLDQNGNPIPTSEQQGGKYGGGGGGGSSMGTNVPAPAPVPAPEQPNETAEEYQNNSVGNMSKYLAPAYNMFMGATKPEYAEMSKYTPNLLTNPERALMPNRLRDSRAAYSSTKNSLVGNMTAGQRNAAMLMAGNNYNRANQDIYGNFGASELDIANKNNALINEANRSNLQVDYMNADNRLKAKSAGRAMIGEGLSQMGEIGQLDEKNDNQLAVDELRSLLYTESIPPNSEAGKRITEQIKRLQNPRKTKKK